MSILVDTQFDTDEIRDAIKATQYPITWYDSRRDLDFPTGDITGALLSIYGYKRLLRTNRINFPHNCGLRTNSFDYSAYFNSWRACLLNRYPTWGPLKYIRTITNPEIKPVFCRPDSGWKPWSGCVLDHNLWSDIGLDAYLDDQMAVVSNVVKIDGEWRCHISDNRIVNIDSYGSYSNNATIEDIASYVSTLLACYPTPPDDKYVIDVALAGGCPWVVELNSWTCSGIYSPAAVQKILAAMV